MRTAFVLWLLGMALGFLVAGCAAVDRDLQGALTRAQAAQTAGLLAPTDPLVPCLQYFSGLTGSGLSDVLRPPFAGVIDIGTDLYIVNTMVQGGAQSDALDAKCAPVALKLLKNAGRRAPGL